MLVFINYWIEKCKVKHWKTLPNIWGFCSSCRNSVDSFCIYSVRLWIATSVSKQCTISIFRVGWRQHFPSSLSTRHDPKNHNLNPSSVCPSVTTEYVRFAYNSLVGTAIHYRSDVQGTNLCGGNIFFSSSFLFIGYLGTFLGGEGPGCGVDYPHPFAPILC